MGQFVSPERREAAAFLFSYKTTNFFFKHLNFTQEFKEQDSPEHTMGCGSSKPKYQPFDISMNCRLHNGNSIHTLTRTFALVRRSDSVWLQQ